MFSNELIYSLASLGGLVLGYYIFSFLVTIYNITIRGGKSLSTYGAGKGAWAVITGASDGIGKAFAFQLAQHKFNVVILARTESKLHRIANEIKEKYGVETLVIPFDFSKLDNNEYTKLFSKLAPLNVSVLVNNVGASHAYPTPFIAEDSEVIQNLVNINITATMKMTHALAKQMKSSSNPGLILNVGSFAGLTPMPLLSVYGATKSYISYWSQAIARELAPHQIDVICLNPMYVVSELSKIRKPNFMAPTAEAFVQSVFHRIGNEAGSSFQYTSSPYPIHAILEWMFINVSPQNVRIQLFYGHLKQIRAKALKKLPVSNSNDFSGSSRARSNESST